MSDPNQQPSLPDYAEPQEDSPTQREEDTGSETGSGGGAGSEGTIPDDPDGLGATVSDEPTTFEPEEDPDAAKEV